MFRNRILLASLLKPVTDTRMYEKIGRSLLKLPEVEVHISGYVAPLPATTENRLFLHPLFAFKRLSWQRVTAQLQYWRLLQKVQPALLIVGTHELLLVSWWYAVRTGAKIIYDVRENYALNLSTQNIYKKGLGSLMAKIVRVIETFTSSRVQHFFLAEQSYAQELPFLGHKFSFLENKYLPSGNFPQPTRFFPVSLSKEQPLRFLYSGTISRLYGTLEAVNFVEHIRQFLPQAELIIIGYCAEERFLEELRVRIQPLPFVKLIGGNKLVPHPQILEQERLCHVGLLPYQPHPSTFACIPTKLYEYAANGLVVIMQQNPLWDAILQRTHCGLPFDFRHSVTAAFIEQLLECTFYSEGVPKGISWEEEEVHLLEVVRSLL